MSLPGVHLKIVAIAWILALTLACGTPQDDPPPAGDAEHAAGVTFSWFEYQGKDEIFAEPLPEGEFHNPILAGFYPDPSIVRADDAFYMVHSSFAYFPGVPIFRSTDLVSWQPLGHVLTRPSQLRVPKAGVSRGIFAPTIRFHDGVFYMITTGIDDAGGNFIVTATNPAGEWSEPHFLPEIDGIDPSLFFDRDGKVYLTHNGPPVGEPLYDGHRAGRETFLLPMSWHDGWPEILPAGELVPYRLPAPEGLPPTAGAEPMTGNFTWRDDFTSDWLGPAWNLLRVAEKAPYQLRPGGGVMLEPRPVGMDGDTQPAFIGRRQQHQTFTASTEIELPAQEGVLAGMVAFQSELHHFYLASRKSETGHEVVLERAGGAKPEVVVRLPVPDDGDGRLVLEVEGDKGRISFFVRPPSAGAERLTVAEDFDASILSTRRAGGFVGTYLGLHARLETP